MRKGSNCDLGKLIKSSVKDVSFNGKHVIVGGHFLYLGDHWTKNTTFNEICQSYLDHLISLNLLATVIFDGYNYIY